MVADRRRRRPRPEGRGGMDFSDVDDRYDDEDDDRRGRGRGRDRGRGRGRGRDDDRGRRKRGGRSDDRGRGRDRGRGGIDFGDVDDDDYDDRYDDRDDDYREPRRRRRRHAQDDEPPARSLMDLCMPVFKYAALLPRDTDGVHPPYQAYRDAVLTALNDVESQAPQNGIEVEDARLACYGLCFFMDEQIAQSEWREKIQWAAEPLGILRQQDPEGGINFFRKLEGFGDRQRDLKEVYLVCLALGYRGRFAEMEATQQAAEIGEIRQRLVHSLRRAPLDRQEELFPEAYLDADPLEDDVAPPPKWWLYASLGTVALVVLIWLGLFFWAGSTPKPIDDRVRPVVAATETGESA